MDDHMVIARRQVLVQLDDDLKELARRAQLVRLLGNDSSSSDLVVALDAMLEHATPALRRTLARPTVAADET